MRLRFTPSAALIATSGGEGASLDSWGTGEDAGEFEGEGEGEGVGRAGERCLGGANWLEFCIVFSDSVSLVAGCLAPSGFPMGA